MQWSAQHSPRQPAATEMPSAGLATPGGPPRFPQKQVCLRLCWEGAQDSRSHLAERPEWCLDLNTQQSPAAPAHRTRAGGKRVRSWGGWTPADSPHTCSARVFPDVSDPGRRLWVSPGASYREEPRAQTRQGRAKVTAAPGTAWARGLHPLPQAKPSLFLSLSVPLGLPSSLSLLLHFPPSLLSLPLIHTHTRAYSSDLDKDHEAVIVSPSRFWADTHSESRAVWANRPLPWAPGCPSLKHQTSQVGSRQTPGHCCIAGPVLGAWSVTILGG